MITIKETKYTHRFLARFVIEAETPLAIGSGQKDILSDSLVALDVNGLPYIPGTSIAGVIRSMLDPKQKSEFYGYQLSPNEIKDKNTPKGRGSEIIFTEGRILNSKQEVVDGIIKPELLDQDPLLREYRRLLPIRQHVCINDKGTAADKGKYDQQVVYAGSRFCFEIECLSDGKNEHNFRDVINALHHHSFRIGGGVHNGYGCISVKSVQTATLNLCEPADLQKYLEKTSSLAGNWPYWQKDEAGQYTDDTYCTYQITLRPDSFIFFGSGFGDAEGNADMTTVKATRVDWNTGQLVAGQLLIPATSVKGALRHRVAYRYNQLTGRFADGANPQNAPKHAEENEAVRALFGYQDGKQLYAGKVLLSDIIETPANHKLVNHVCIDRFTGGAIDGALFTEQVDYAAGREFTLDIMVEKSAFPENDNNVRKAFEQALDDLCHGLLPLGGGVNRGNGIFTGSYTKMPTE